MQPRSDVETAADGPGASATPRVIDSRRVLLIAVPVVLSNALSPLQGAVDTAVIGNLGAVDPLAAVGLGAEIFALLFGSFNFLQIGASGLSAQALGAGRSDRVMNTLLRGLIIALGIALLLMALQRPILGAALSLFEASAGVEAITAEYFSVRIWGAPAELANFALLGWFAGQELTSRLVAHQAAISLLNIGLSITFVVGLGWGVPGVALGTVIANYLGLAFALYLAWTRRRTLLPASWRPDRARLLDRAELARLFALNRDIFIRTLLLISAFAWMARQGSILGDEVLAANVVLWQFFAVSAYALDGFAIAAESLVGQTVGERRRDRLDRAVRLTAFWMATLALLLSLLFYVSSGAIIDLFTTSETVRETARIYALWAAFIPIVGVWAFHMDGVFVGATGSAEMRNSMIVASLVYFPLAAWAAGAIGNHGVWAAVWFWLLLRALTLLALYPRVRARASAPPT